MININGQCQRCRHLIYENGKMTSRCKAYPNGIPPEIFAPDLDDKPVDHRRPYPGDNGVRWEAIKPGVNHPLEETK